MQEKPKVDQLNGHTSSREQAIAQQINDVLNIIEGAKKTLEHPQSDHQRTEAQAIIDAATHLLGALQEAVSEISKVNPIPGDLSGLKEKIKTVLDSQELERKNKKDIFNIIKWAGQLLNDPTSNKQQKEDAAAIIQRAQELLKIIEKKEINTEEESPDIH